MQDAGTNAAIVGAQVYFHDLNHDDILFVAAATTDASGNYSQNLPDGDYAVLTHAPGTYINQFWNGLSCSAVCDIGSNGQNITPVTVAGNVKTGIDFSLVSGGGGIAGTVTNSVGSPLAGVTVFMLDSHQGVPFASGITDGAGHYTVAGSVTGNVFVATLNSLGYQDESYNNHKCANLNCNSTPDFVAVTLGGTTNNIDFALDPGGRISGRVTDALGNPLANVTVVIADSTGSDVDAEMTDGSGNFISTGLAAGTYYAGTENSAGYVDKVWTDLTCPGNWCSPTNGTPISVTVSNTTTGINFALTPGAPISGTVTAAAGGAPIANAEVDIFDASGNVVTGASTNNSGAYTTPALPTGEYFAAISFRVPSGFVAQLYDHISCPNNICSFTSGKPIPVTANTPVSNINFSLLATGNGSITGHVTDSSLGTGVISQVVLVGMNGVQQVTTVNSVAGTGAYTFSNVAAGSYYVRTSSSSLINEVYPNIVCLSCNSMLSGGQLVTVTNGVATGPIDFALDPGGHFTGTITNAAGGAALPNIGVQIFNAAGIAIDGGRVSANGAGVYTSSGLPPGTYYARTSNIQGFVNKQWNGLDCPQTSCLPTSGTPIVINGVATTSGIDFSLTLGGRIAGSLADATTHAPITFQAVTLFSSAGVNLGNVSTDNAGNYTSQGLPAGTYFVRTATGTTFLNNQLVGYVDQLWNGTACIPACLSPTTGTPVVVTNGITTGGINFSLTVAGSITGTVVDAAAPTTGVPGIGVQIYTAAGVFAKATATNSVGGFVVGGLPAGTYYARTSSGPNQFYLDELYHEMPCGAGCTVTAGTPITVPPLGMASGVDFTLSAGAGSISGTVTDAVTSAALPAVTVQIYASDGTFVKSVNSNIAGAFAAGGLTPGTYFARSAVISGSAYADQVFDGMVCHGTCAVTTGTPIVVAASATRTGVDFKLSVPPPTMAVDRTSLVFTAVNNGSSFASATGSQTVRMTQTGSPAIAWSIGALPSWLHVTPASGNGSATLTFSVLFAPGLAPAQATAVSINLTGAGGAVGPITVTLNSIAPSAAAAPFGAFDTPANGSAGLAGSVAVTGWALDDIQVTRVTICRDAVAPETAPIDGNCGGNAKIYIGDAIFVEGARTDVQALNPTLPLNSRGGWGYLMLTNFLPGVGNGTFTLRAYAFDADGHSVLLGSKTITCDNAHATQPFGSIDTPAQGGVVSGTIANSGWVLTQSPKDIPADSSTVTAFIDGLSIGNLDPGRIARADITSLFSPSYDTTHAAGGKIIDTTAFSNGVHTIFWIVTDTGNNGDGIGSRFFTISNGSQLVAQAHGAGASAAGPMVIAAPTRLDVPSEAAIRLAAGDALESEIAAAPADLSPIQGRRGFDLERALQTYEPHAGRIDVQAQELDRIELHLSVTPNHQYSGYLRTPAGLRPLPVGSTLNAATGEFAWMPGVGFYGTYDFVFVRWSRGAAVARQDVRIVLNAKGSNRVGPQTVIDLPGAGRAFRAGDAFFLAGWAADLDAVSDSGVSAIHVWAYPVDGAGNRLPPAFLGTAVYGGERPDVAAVYGERFKNSGYGLSVAGLAPGTYDIAVFAYSTVVNNFTAAKVVRVTVR